MCHHTPEPTVLSTVSSLNIDRFQQPCLLPWRTSRIGGACHPRTTWRPLTLAGSPVLPPLYSPRRQDGTTAGRYFALLHMRVPPPGVRTHAGSGPSRVRRHLLAAYLGDPIPLVTTVVGVLDLRVSSSPELRSFFAQHVHQCSGVDHEFSLFWLFRRGCQHYPGFGRRAERSFCLLF